MLQICITAIGRLLAAAQALKQVSGA